jgi:hypothetical protein
MPQYGTSIKTKNGDYKKLILDLSNYINPISKEKEIFTREDIAKMTPKEFEQNGDKIMMQMNSIGVPTEADLRTSQNQDYENDDTAQWIWVLDDTKKTHCDFCLSMEGETFENEEDAPEIPVHYDCGCQLVKFVTS